MTDHTPTPWRTIKNIRTGIFAPDENGSKIAATKGGHGFHDIPDDLAQANAAFIVKAVNSHDDLVKALERSRDSIRSVYHEIDNPAMPACLAAAWEVADLTLAAVSTGSKT